MHLKRLPVLLAAVASLAGPANAEGNDAPACGAFSMTGGEKIIHVIDNDPIGPSLGDQRIGSRQLLEAAGKVVGTVYYNSTVAAVEPDGSGGVLTSAYFISFADGWIATQSLYVLKNAWDTGQGAGDATLVVSGGTGTFSGATGTITLKAGDPPTYVFDLTCH